MTANLTQARLRDVLQYSPTKGEWRWRVIHKHQPPDGLAGRVNGNGYREIRIDGRLYKTSRLAWLYVHGSWPPHTVDHKNRRRDDDRFSNLRLSTDGQNARNKGRCRSGVSKYKGVSLERNGRWYARIAVDGKQMRLGTFGDEVEAARAYDAASIRFHGAFGYQNFSRTRE
jgi:hypothetical protein